MSNGISQMTH